MLFPPTSCCSVRCLAIREVFFKYIWKNAFDGQLLAYFERIGNFCNIFFSDQLYKSVLSQVKRTYLSTSMIQSSKILLSIWYIRSQYLNGKHMSVTLMCYWGWGACMAIDSHTWILLYNDRSHPRVFSRQYPFLLGDLPTSPLGFGIAWFEGSISSVLAATSSASTCLRCKWLTVLMGLNDSDENSPEGGLKSGVGWNNVLMVMLCVLVMQSSAPNKVREVMAGNVFAGRYMGIGRDMLVWVHCKKRV